MSTSRSSSPLYSVVTSTPTRVRYLVLSLLALAVADAYVTRVIAAASTTIQKELAVSNEQMGYILGGFFLGYIWFQVPGAWVANRLGTRVVLPTLAMLWSLCTIWTAIAASGAELGYARVALGLTQAGLVPCCIKVVADWFPIAERGFASAVLTCSMQGGAVIASGLTANLLPLLGWRNVFLIYSAVGILWAILFYIWFRNQPGEHWSTNQAEQTLIQDHQSVRDSVSLPKQRHDMGSCSKLGISETKSLFAVMLTSWSMWAICCQAILRSFGYAFFTSWFPAYLERAYGIQMISAGTLTVIPLVGVGVGSLFGGLLIDGVLRRTGSRWWSRSGSTAVALTLSAVCTLAATRTMDPFLTVLIVSSGSCISGVANPATWAATIDISGEHSAIAMGVLNTAGNVGALVCPIALGYVFSFIEQSRSDWHLVLYLFAGIYFAGAVCWVKLDPSRLAIDKP